MTQLSDMTGWTVTEIKFVPEDWSEDPRGYKYTVVTDHQLIASTAEYFELGLIGSRDQIRLCGEVNHQRSLGGCGVKRPDGTWHCEYFFESIKDDMRTSDRTKLVHIEIPTPLKNKNDER